MSEVLLRKLVGFRGACSVGPRSPAASREMLCVAAPFTRSKGLAKKSLYSHLATFSWILVLLGLPLCQQGQSY
jgi:hypothetical protein